MIPVLLVTGFLGSGKTTLLERMTSFKPTGTVYLVNEFSPKDVDGRRLELEDNSLVTISGGSIFCRCKATDFINALHKVSAEYPNCPALVVETSGIADPAVFPRMLTETSMDKEYRLQEIICIVEPGTLPKLMHTLEAVRNQLTSASVILLNKTDLFSAVQIEKTEQLIRSVNTTAPIIRTVNCNASTDIFTAESAAYTAPSMQGEYAKCAPVEYARATLTLSSSIDWNQLKTCIDKEINTLYRAKGRIPCSGQTLEIDYSGGVWQERPARHSSGGELILIASGEDSEALENIQHRFTTTT